MGAQFWWRKMVALGELLLLPVAIFTTTQLWIDNAENKILIWLPQLLKELTGGDGYLSIVLNQMLYHGFKRPSKRPEYRGKSVLRNS